jgi:putative hydrolase of the HAD superfamily
MKELYKTGKWSDSEYWNWAATEWGLNLTAEEFMKIYVDGCSTDENVVKIVRELREKGYKTMICTDNFPARIKGMQDKFGFLNDFDVKIISYEVGATKASPVIYRELIKQSGVLPEEIVFSDDDEKKLMAANGLGIYTFVYENFEQFMDELKKLGVNIN